MWCGGKVKYVVWDLDSEKDRNIVIPIPHNVYRSDSLQLSAASCLATITETLPKFLSSFIADIITTVV